MSAVRHDDPVPRSVAQAGTVVELELAAAYRDHRGAVFSIARSMCGPIAAEDVVQDVFLDLWSNLGRYDPSRGSLRTLLVIMAHHRAVDYLRSNESWRRRDQRWFSSSEQSPSDVEGQIIDNDMSRRILAAIGTLPPREKEAILTAYYEECTYREAAVALGESEGTVKSRIRSGLTRLATALSDTARVAPS